MADETKPDAKTDGKQDPKPPAKAPAPTKLISLAVIERGAAAAPTGAFTVFTESDSKEAARLVDIGAATPWTRAAEKKLVEIVDEAE